MQKTGFSWSCLFWKRVSLWMWSLGGRQQPFYCVLGHFRHDDKRTTMVNSSDTRWHHSSRSNISYISYWQSHTTIGLGSRKESTHVKWFMIWICPCHLNNLILFFLVVLENWKAKLNISRATGKAGTYPFISKGFVKTWTKIKGSLAKYCLGYQVWKLIAFPLCLFRFIYSYMLTTWKIIF